jgi:hypothetical protein
LRMMHLQDSNTDVRNRVHETDDPGILVATPIEITTLARCGIFRDSESLRERQIGSIGAYQITC